MFFKILGYLLISVLVKLINGTVKDVTDEKENLEASKSEVANLLTQRDHINGAQMLMNMRRVACLCYLFYIVFNRVTITAATLR